MIWSASIGSSSSPLASPRVMYCSPCGPPTVTATIRWVTRVGSPETGSKVTTSPTWLSCCGTLTTTSPGERSEEHTSELQSRIDIVCHILLEKNIDSGVIGGFGTNHLTYT